MEDSRTIHIRIPKILYDEFAETLGERGLVSITVRRLIREYMEVRKVNLLGDSERAAASRIVQNT